MNNNRLVVRLAVNIFKNMNNIKMIAMGCKPDPHKFTIKKIVGINGCTIILANYEGCLSFGGDKLMLLKGSYNIADFETLDPHFLDDDYAVIGRFIPNELGWEMARDSSWAVANQNK